MNKKLMLVVAFGAIIICSAFAQEIDAKTVTPAWVTEKQFGQAAVQPTVPTQAAKTSNTFDVFFIGYDVPTLSGSLATYITPWGSPYNFSFGFESCNKEGSGMLNGFEMEFLVASENSTWRFVMNDLVLVGYSFDLKPVRFNLGGQIGLTMLDVTDYQSQTFTGLGFVVGPQASLYVALDSSFWLWVKARYSLAWYMSLDSGTTPISSGYNALDCVSLQAGLAFKL